MTMTFQDNEEVTLESINNIAMDLGATSFSAFSEETFGVDKLNQITSDLVSAGILKTEDNGDLGLKIGCRPTYADGVVTVGHGTIVFESGAKVYINQPVNIEATIGAYIYAYNDVIIGKASLMVSDMEPAEGDYVMLARVLENGTLKDLRKSTEAKVIIPTYNVLKNYTIEMAAELPKGDIVTFDMGTMDAAYVIIWSVGHSSFLTAYKTEFLIPGRNNLIPITDEMEKRSVYLTRNESAVSEFCMYIQKRGQYIDISFDRAMHIDTAINIGVI